MKVLDHLQPRHKTSCAQWDPTPSRCDCGAQWTPLVSLTEAEAEIKRARAQASPAKPDLAGLTALHKELGQMKWMGSDAGWDLAIDAVRKRIESLLAAITKETDHDL